MKLHRFFSINIKIYIIISIIIYINISIISTSCKNISVQDNKSPATTGDTIPEGPVINPVVDDTLSVFPMAPANDSIFEAALSGLRSEVIRMLNTGIDINSLDQDGRTVLMYASFDGHTELMRDLLKRGVNVNLQDNYGRTALMLASSGPFPDAVKLLLDHGADPNIVDKAEKYSALMYAAAEGQLEVVKILLKYHADPNLKDIDGEDAVTFAGNNGHDDVVEYLTVMVR